MGCGSRSLLVSAAGAAALVACAGGALAIGLSDVRSFLGWNAWPQAGVTGSSTTVAVVEGGHPLPTHSALAGRIAMELSWPWNQSTDIGNVVPAAPPARPTPGRNWNSTHATAVASAIVGTGANQIGGLSPQSKLISMSFASGIDPFSGNYISFSPTSLAFALFAATDQGVANSVCDALGVERYTVATVVNSSFSQRPARDGREGEDQVSRIYNICASMTGATIITPVGPQGDDPALDQLNPPEGSAQPPSTAYNTIAVGATDESFNSPRQDSGKGLLPVIEWAVAASLIPAGADPSGPPPLPTEPELFQKRPGPDLMAPGTNLRLAGSIAGAPDNPTQSSFSDFWTGTSFSTALVSAAAALVHDAGMKQGLWVTGRPSAVLTRALLINSASKAGDVGGLQFNNNAQPDPVTRVINTSQALDEETGGGQLDFKRLLDQFVNASTRDVRGLAGFTVQPGTEEYTLPVVGTDPRVPFVTNPGGAASRGGTVGDNAIPAQIIRGAVGAEIPSEIEGARPMQLGNGDDPPLSQDDPPLGTPWTGQLPPLPGGMPGGGGGGGLPFRSGWDVGNIGVGSIDIPLGTFTAGSGVRITLCWNRHESWIMPNFAGPMSFIDPSLVIAPGFIRPVAPAAQQARAAARAAAPGAAPIGHMTKVSTIDGSGVCHWGAKHAVVRNADGSLMPGPDADALVEAKIRSMEAGPLTPAPQTRAQQRAANNLDIQFNFGPSLQNRPDFRSAIEAAASIWESVMLTPVTVRIDMDIAPLPPNVIGGTLSEFMLYDYPDVRSAMISRASMAEMMLLNSLPLDAAPFVGPDGDFSTDDSEGIVMTSANAKALGLDTSFLGSRADASILLSSAFQFDFDPSNGVDPDKIDLVFVMVHELGHALGFTSEVDDFTGLPTTLDLLRFGIGSATNNPMTLFDWQSFPREFRVGVEAALDTVDGIVGVSGAAELDRFSTGAALGGDGRQASHWKDDALLGLSQAIGVMDPTYRGPNGGPGGYAPAYVTAADLLAFGLLGWDTDFTRPPTLPPGAVPVIFSSPLSTDSDSPIEFFQVTPDGNRLISNSLAFENYDLQLWRSSNDGTGNQLIATSTTTDSNVEHIYLPRVQSTGNPTITNAQYFVRIFWAGTRVDLGGYDISNNASVPRAGYMNLPSAQSEYGLAWYIDLNPVTGNTIVDNGGGAAAVAGDLNGDGVVDSGDLAALLSAWGTNNAAADLTHDGRVDSADLARLLGSFGNH